MTRNLAYLLIKILLLLRFDHLLIVHFLLLSLAADETVTFGALSHLIAHDSNLYRIGLKPGDPVAYLTPFGPINWRSCFLSIWQSNNHCST